MKDPLSKYLTVNKEQVLRVSKTGEIWLGGNKATKEELKSLQEEIKFIEKTRFWEIITNYIPEQARLIMFEKAQTFDDMKTGKAMLLNLDLIVKIKDSIKRQKV